ncbi:MAG: hypothetical protein NXI24_09620 [bacterium]|nr:hypothetical protein [bacterium]
MNKTVHIFRNFKKSLLAAVLIGAFTVNCSALTEDSDDDNLSTLLVAALAAQCNLGGFAFNAVGPGCSIAGASGTGTLTAAQTQTSFVSALVSFRLLDASGSLSMVAGLNPSLGVATQNEGGELAISATQTKKPQDPGAGAAGAGTTTQTWCIEIHVDESPIHVLLDQTGACSAKAATAVSYENDANGPSQNGGLWGFVLNNAEITGFVPNSSKLYSE